MTGGHVSGEPQRDYWDAVAGSKRFTHPVDPAWLNGVARDAAVLDYGCGYGRTLGELTSLGFTNLVGLDISPKMIARARAEHPGPRFAVLQTPPTLDLPDASVDMVLLLAVLTCMPADEDQRRLIAELHRVLVPGGRLLVSDLLLQDDERNQARYARFTPRHGHGVFETDDGAICRHHPDSWLVDLLAAFHTADTRRVTVPTMNGHPVTAVQFLAVKS
jgi:SAM-dependent methyltransferase